MQLDFKFDIQLQMTKNYYLDSINEMFSEINKQCLIIGGISYQAF